MDSRKFIDKLQINKFAGFLVTSGLASLIMGCSYYGDNNIDIFDIFSLVVGAANMGFSFPLVKKQNKRYERLTNIIEKKGFNEEVCSRYMDHPCGRSVVKTVLKRTGNFNKYSELKRNYPLTRLY